MNSDELRGLAAASHLFRDMGADTLADHLDIRISAELEGAFLSEEFDRNLAAHRERLRREGELHGPGFLPDWMAE